MIVASVITDAANVATAIAVVLVAFELMLNRRQLRASFERTFVDRYEAIVGRVPLALLLGEQTDDPAEPARRAFYDYFELCEEELYFRRVGKVGTATWLDWWEGMAMHLRRPAFRHAWDALKDAAVVPPSNAARTRVEQFSLLRRAVEAIDAGTAHDPRDRWPRR